MKPGRSAPILICAAACLIGLAPARAADSPLEVAVKATYVYKFAAFIGWPNMTDSEPLQLCVAGDDRFGPVLEQAVRGQRAGIRPIALTHIDHVERGVPCHVLLVFPSHTQTVADALAKVRGGPVLTVTDEAPDEASRGMIDFVLRDNRVRFRIDARSAEQSRLTVSSKLMGLAVRP